MVEEVEEVGWPARAKDLEGGDERRTNNPAPHHKRKERRVLNKRFSLFHVSSSALQSVFCLVCISTVSRKSPFLGVGGGVDKNLTIFEWLERKDVTDDSGLSSI
jgi:hypothetical protein